MTASIVHLSLDQGILHFHCPVCGVAIVESEIGLSEELCPHVVVIVDWIDELIVGPAVADELSESLQSAFDDDDNAIEALAKNLPPTVVVFEMSEPNRGGGHTGDSITIAIDFAFENEVDD